jgi:hypothetical protein
MVFIELLCDARQSAGCFEPATTPILTGFVIDVKWIGRHRFPFQAARLIEIP